MLLIVCFIVGPIMKEKDTGNKFCRCWFVTAY